MAETRPEVDCPLCGDYNGEPSSVVSHITASTDSAHLGVKGEDHMPEILDRAEREDADGAEPEPDEGAEPEPAGEPAENGQDEETEIEPVDTEADNGGPSGLAFRDPIEVESEVYDDPEVRIDRLESKVSELRAAVEFVVHNSMDMAVEWDHFEGPPEGAGWRTLPCGHSWFHEDSRSAEEGMSITCNECGETWEAEGLSG